MRGIVLICFIVFQTFAWSQEISQTLRGIVQDESTKLPIPGVKVLIKNTEPTMGAITNENGVFVIENVPVGRQTVSFSYLGYSTLLLEEIYIKGGEEKLVDVYLQETSNKLEKVEVTANRRKVRNESAIVSAWSLGVDELSRIPVVLDDPARMARKLPGVTPSPYITFNEIAVRGNATRAVLWRLDDIDIYNPNHFGTIGGSGGSITIFSQRLLSNTDFYTGSFPADYGNALGGIFDVHFRNGNSYKRQHSFQLNILGVDFATEGPFSKNGRSSYILNYRLSTTSLAEKFLNLGFLPVYQDLSFKLNFKTKKGANLSFFGVGGVSSTSQSAVLDTAAWSDPESADSNYGYFARAVTGTLGMTYLKPLNKRTYIKSTLVGTGLKSDFQGWYVQPDLITADTAFERIERDYRVSLQTFINHKSGPRHAHRSGIIVHGIYSKVANIYKDEEDIGDIAIPRNDSVLIGSGQTVLTQAYSRSQFYLNEKWRLNVGVHAMYLNYTNELSVEPRFGLRYQMNRKNSMSIAYGLHSQMDPFFTYLAQTKDTVTNSLVQKNSDLKFNKAHHITLAYRSQLNNKWRLGVELYYQMLYNMTVGVENPVSRVGGYSAVFESIDLDNGGKGQNYGVELAVERSFKRGLYFMSNLSLFESNYTANDNVKRNSQYNARIILNSMIGKEWRLSKNKKRPQFISVNLSGTYSGSQYYTAMNLEESISRGFLMLDLDNPNTEKQDALIILDAGLSIKSNRQKLNSELTLQISNLLNRKPQVGVFYDQLRQDEGILTGSGLIPFIGWRINF